MLSWVIISLLKAPLSAAIITKSSICLWKFSLQIYCYQLVKQFSLPKKKLIKQRTILTSKLFVNTFDDCVRNSEEEDEKK